MNVYSSFISNAQLETTQMLFNGQMVKKLWYIHVMEYYSAMNRMN